ncbi:MAG: S-layer homology domain-containing protein [Defluviitaleaceae bacterium]|nr:S-layer homology domain-containing protein [Defluviitaleaceae bacterium]
MKTSNLNNLTKRVIAVFLTIALVAAVLPARLHASPVDITDDFTCLDFRAAVRELLGKGSADAIYNVDVAWVGFLDVSGTWYEPGNITSLAGIEHFTNLIVLTAAHNNITSLDLSNNSALEWLGVGNNNITTLNLSNNPALHSLSIWDNNLTTLDLSNNLVLQFLDVGNNNFITLDLSNTLTLRFLNVRNNNFTTINLSNNLALQSLVVDSNNLTTLDLSNNPILQSLFVENNSLTTLDLSNNPMLQSLFVDNNNFTSLDLFNNSKLQSLHVWNNNLITVDLSNNPALEWLSLGDNNLTSLDLSNNPALQFLFAENNNLTSLDISNNPALEWLTVWDNYLPNIDAVVGWRDIPALVVDYNFHFEFQRTPATHATVRFFTNYGETFLDGTPHFIPRVVELDTAVGADIPTLLRQDFVFTGWNTEADGTGYDFTDLSVVNANIDLFAKWMPVWVFFPAEDYYEHYRFMPAAPAPTPETTPDPVTPEPEVGEEVTYTTSFVSEFDDVSEDDWFYRYVKTVVQNGLFHGADERVFSPTEGMTRAMFVQVLANLANVDFYEDFAYAGFADVDADAWYANVVNWAAYTGIDTGRHGTNLFEPSVYITWHEISAVLFNFFNIQRIAFDTTSIELDEYTDDMAGTVFRTLFAMQAANITRVYPNGTVDAANTATRALVAEVFAFILQAIQN